MKTKFILFDFDGVIADSFDVAFDTNKVICPAITKEDYQRRFEGNINEIEHPETFHSEECNHDLDWFDVYIPKMKERAKIFPEMKDLILELEKEYLLVIISSTITFPIEEFLTLHDLREHFDWVMGNDVHKSKVEKIKMVFDKYGVKPEDCIFITDTLGDMREASKMNVPLIGVTWGFCTPETLKRGRPLKLVDTPNELKAAIAEHFSS
jgi:phosphoglycolate phosphatase